MKRLYIERFYLNRADDEYPMTVRIILQMKDGVDGHLLEEAVAATRRRYPYLCVKLGVERDADGSEHYVYHDNPRPWKVSGCRQPVCLCSEEANEHLMAFSWWDDCVALDFFHALIDGTAAYRILRTIREMRTETDSAYMIVVEVSAAAGVFSISFMQRFATDVYLDTFLDELHQQGLTYEIPDRHPLQIAPIADYRGGWIKEPEATDEEAKNEYTLIDRQIGIYASVMKRYIAFLTVLVTSLFAMAQDFMPMEHNGLLYQELVSCNDVKGKIPLIIYLHGRHASGNDNQKQLSQTGVQEIDKYLRKNAISAYFLVPQCPEDYEWDGRNGKSGYTDKVEDLINHYLNTKDIDTNRVYICGASMGACGTWKLLKDNPKLFAAALIASGQAQHEKPTDYADTPLYVTVGSEERSYDALKWFTTEIRKAGGNVKFDVLFGQKHRNACDNAFSTKRIKWLFSQERD